MLSIHSAVVWYQNVPSDKHGEQSNQTLDAASGSLQVLDHSPISVEKSVSQMCNVHVCWSDPPPPPTPFRAEPAGERWLRPGLRKCTCVFHLIHEKKAAHIQPSLLSHPSDQ